MVWNTSFAVSIVKHAAKLVSMGSKECKNEQGCSLYFPRCQACFIVEHAAKLVSMGSKECKNEQGCSFYFPLLHKCKTRIGTQNGVSRFDGKSWKNFTVEDGLADNNISAILKQRILE